VTRLAYDAGAALNPYVEDLSKVVVQAYGIYQINNRKTLLDTIDSLFSSVPGCVSQSVIANILPMLWTDFDQLNESDALAQVYLHTFGVIVSKAGPSVIEVCKPLYLRSLSYIEETMTMLATCEEAIGISPDDVDREFMWAGLELISDFSEGIGAHLPELMDFDTFLPLIKAVLEDTDEMTREIVFALLGDLAKVVPNHIAPLIPITLQYAGEHIYPPDDSVNLSNNAIYVLSEVTAQIKDGIRPLAPPLVAKVVLLLQASYEDKLTVNGAIALCRIALFCTDLVAPHLNDCGAALATNCYKAIKWDGTSESERLDCIKGLLAAVNANPQSMADGFAYFVKAVVAAKNSPPEIQQASVAVLNAVRAAMQASGRWAAIHTSLPIVLKQELKVVYGIGE